MITQWTANDVQQRMTTGQPLQIIDVRQPGEYMSGHIAGSKLIPLGELPGRLTEIDPNIEAVIVCHSGGRSSQACDFLLRNGYEQIRNLRGGMMFWDGDVE
ncbi:rhodanese-like domain-containing protein [Alicyclobacillus sp. ALC3]|uniref:rhodanese-like domain-containing protein n=1 Tax=Alicyclobacillus sp. ALC3 TaxID=2796143 RepID=UPI002379476E|nr:rhodanese-like domain-containing protein [Alicyclobacillus sp. ALC3]WDL98772.1 rhodanese-like domain-containing protein [Alicyclobacillus sp. ALC3]